MVDATSTRGKVLVIDDSEIVLDALRLALEQAGYSVTTQSSPFGTSAAVARTKPDIILLDVTMPGLGGVDIARLLRTTDAGRRACLLLHSGRPASELATAVAECGADGYITKGLDESEFLREVERLLSARAAASDATLG